MSRVSNPLLSKRERKGLDARIEEFNLEGRVPDCPLLPDELIHSRLANLTRAVRVGIGSMTFARLNSVQLQSKPNGCPVLCRAQNHVEIAAVKPEHDLAGRRFEPAALASDLPRSSESPLIQTEP